MPDALYSYFGSKSPFGVDLLKDMQKASGFVEKDGLDRLSRLTRRYEHEHEDEAMDDASSEDGTVLSFGVKSVVSASSSIIGSGRRIRTATATTATSERAGTEEDYESDYSLEGIEEQILMPIPNLEDEDHAESSAAKRTKPQMTQSTKKSAAKPKKGLNPKKGRKELYKTELCKLFMETGVCKFGSDCAFAHGIEDLRSLPKHPKHKTKYCRNLLLTGRCAFGDKCAFIH